MDTNNLYSEDAGQSFEPTLDQVIDQAAEIDCSPPKDGTTGPIALAPNLDVVPEEWFDLLDQQFAGKTFGLQGFGHDFKKSILTQVASVKRVLEAEVRADDASQDQLTVEQINNLIDICDNSGCPDKTGPYVKQMIILTLREDIGRTYFKGLQAQGEMMGISYGQLTAPPAPVPTEMFSEVTPTLT